MANNPQFTNAVAQALATAFGVAVDAGSAALIRIYSGTQPTTADDSITGTLLAELTCEATAGAVSDGTPGGLYTFDTITGESSAPATGTATHFVIITQDAGTVVMMGSVGTSNADLVFNTVAFTELSAVDITALTVTFPEG
ncbi:MAG TPA: hypothetical protein VGA20_04345 [Gemmatimonadales bacterium]